MFFRIKIGLKIRGITGRMEEEAEAEDIPGVEILSFMQIDNLFKIRIFL